MYLILWYSFFISIAYIIVSTHNTYVVVINWLKLKLNWNCNYLCNLNWSEITIIVSELILVKIHCVSRKVHTFKLSVALSYLADFQNFCTARKRMKFATKPTQHYPPHLRPLTDDPSFSYEKLVRETWSKKPGRLSSSLVQVFSRTRNLDGLEHCSILYEKLEATWLKCCVAIV